MQILSVTGDVVACLARFEGGFPHAIVIYKTMKDLAAEQKKLASSYLPVIETKIDATEIRRVLVPEQPEQWSNSFITVFDECDAKVLGEFGQPVKHRKLEPEKTVWVARGHRFDSLDRAKVSVRRGDSIDHLVSTNWV